ncbi:MAG: hypothetical protein P1V81_15705 [Planctomycetota bacterium]|nr:hypothetical protein [Planctomycetota bacterium]
MTAALVLLALAGLSLPEEDLFTERLVATMPAGAALEGTSFLDPNGELFTPRSPVRWSPDGSQVAYVAYLADGTHPVVGDEVGPAFDYIDPPVFHGNEGAFRVGNREGKDREVWWVWRGEASIKQLGKGQDWIGAIALSPDDGEAVFWTQPGAKVMAGGAYDRSNQVFQSPWKKGKQWSDASSLTAPLFDPDGKRIYTAAMKGSEWFVLTIDKKGEHRAKQGFGMLQDMVLQPDGDGLALVVPDTSPRRGGSSGPSAPPGFGSGGMKSVVQVGKETFGADFDSAGAPAYSADGKHLAYKVKRKGQFGILVDAGDEPVAWHDFVTTPVFGPKGKQLAYAANQGTEVQPWFDMKLSMDRADRTGTEQVVIQDRKGKQVETGEHFQRIEGLTWSPDGELLAFAAQGEEGWRVHAGDKVSDAYDHIGELHFSKDGKRLAFGARTEREFWWRVLELDTE